MFKAEADTVDKNIAITLQYNLSQILQAEREAQENQEVLRQAEALLRGIQSQQVKLRSLRAGRG